MTCQAFGKKSAKAKATQLIVLFESFIVFLLLEQRHSRHGTIDDMKTSSRWVDGVSRHLNTLRNIKSCVNIEVCPVCPLFSRDDVCLSPSPAASCTLFGRRFQHKIVTSVQWSRRLALSNSFLNEKAVDLLVVISGD